MKNRWYRLPNDCLDSTYPSPYGKSICLQPNEQVGESAYDGK